METMENGYARAKDLYDSGLHSLALKVLDDHLATQPQDSRSLELKGIICHALQDFETGRAAIESASCLYPLTPSAELALADCYWFLDEHDMAAWLYGQLASRDQIPFPLLSGLAIGLSRLKDYDRAMGVCQKAAEIEPNCHHSRYGVAFYMSKSGYPPEFIYPVLTKVVSLAPGIFCYRMAVATVLCRMREFDRAYLSIADATIEELESVTCRCCLERLIRLYGFAKDQRRSEACIRLLKAARGRCTENQDTGDEDPTERCGE